MSAMSALDAVYGRFNPLGLPLVTLFVNILSVPLSYITFESFVPSLALKAGADPQAAAKYLAWLAAAFTALSGVLASSGHGRASFFAATVAVAALQFASVLSKQLAGALESLAAQVYTSLGKAPPTPPRRAAIDATDFLLRATAAAHTIGALGFYATAPWSAGLMVALYLASSTMRAAASAAFVKAAAAEAAKAKGKAKRP